MLCNLKFLGRAFNPLWNGFFTYHILQEVDTTTLNKFDQFDHFEPYYCQTYLTRNSGE